MHYPAYCAAAASVRLPPTPPRTGTELLPTLHGHCPSRTSQEHRSGAHASMRRKALTSNARAARSSNRTPGRSVPAIAGGSRKSGDRRSRYPLPRLSLRRVRRQVDKSPSFRDECLNEHWFVSLYSAQHTIEAWRIDYECERPHSKLRDLTPREFALMLADATPSFTPSTGPT